MSVSNSLDKFGKQVVKESKTDLTKKKKNASKELYNSIKYSFKEHKNSFHLSFEMSEHGKFLDKGVAGNNDPNFKGKKKTVQKSSAGYHFGSGNFKGKGGEWKKRIDKWMYSRGIAARDNKTGKFVKRDTVNYLIRRSIFQYGTKETLFFTKPYESAFKSLPEEIIEAYGLEVDELFNNVFK
tara:strand:+ start:436 stop:981 length:546 start_codon:yes stop_codon:yes gene_type:complete